jgi:antirestriction protein ArdC
MPADIYQQVTDRIVAALENGVSPWRKPWASGTNGLPRNVVSTNAYRGVNVWLLWLMAEEKGWSSGLFGTYRQWQQLGGHVRRAEHGTKIVFWNVSKKMVRDDESGEEEEKRRFFARTYTVFNAEQCAGASLDRFQAPVIDLPFVDFEPAEKMIAATGADIRIGGDKAFYHPANDFIQLPRKESFESTAAFYSTALHELTHWTGHTSRLNRLDKLARFGSGVYAVEELVAEMGAAYLTAALGVPNESSHDNAAAYVAHWLQVLRADAKAVFTASSAATKAADFLLGFRQDSKSEQTEEPIAA